MEVVKDPTGKMASCYVCVQDMMDVTEPLVETLKALKARNVGGTGAAGLPPDSQCTLRPEHAPQTKNRGLYSCCVASVSGAWFIQGLAGRIRKGLSSGPEETSLISFASQASRRKSLSVSP